MLGRADDRGGSSLAPATHGEAVAENEGSFEGDDIPF